MRKVRNFLDLMFKSSSVTVTLYEVLLIKAAPGRQFEEQRISWRVSWPRVIAIWYRAACLRCQTLCSSSAVARSFTPSIHLWDAFFHGSDPLCLFLQQNVKHLKQLDTPQLGCVKSLVKVRQLKQLLLLLFFNCVFFTTQWMHSTVACSLNRLLFFSFIYKKQTLVLFGFNKSIDISCMFHAHLFSRSTFLLFSVVHFTWTYDTEPLWMLSRHSMAIITCCL